MCLSTNLCMSYVNKFPHTLLSNSSGFNPSSALSECLTEETQTKTLWLVTRKTTLAKYLNNKPVQISRTLEHCYAKRLPSSD